MRAPASARRAVERAGGGAVNRREILDGEIVGFDAVATAKQQRALDDIFELADIARPAMREQAIERSWQSARRNFSSAAAVAQQQRRGDRADVEAALGEAASASAASR
jgi:hypothetical protein